MAFTVDIELWLVCLLYILNEVCFIVAGAISYFLYSFPQKASLRHTINGRMSGKIREE